MADAAEEPPAAEEPAPQAEPEAAEEPTEAEAEAAAAVLQSAAPKSPRMLAQQGSNVGEKGAALNSTVQLDPEDGDVQEQLRQILIDNAVRVIDLFRDWDDDENGRVDKKEFRKAMKALGLDVPRKEVDGLFDTFDPDGGAWEHFDRKRLVGLGLIPSSDGKFVSSKGHLDLMHCPEGSEGSKGSGGSNSNSIVSSCMPPRFS